MRVHAAAAAVLVSSIATPAQAAFTRAPWIQDATKSSVAIYWEAGSSGGTQKLEYGPTGGPLDVTVTGTNVQFNLYKAVVSNLAPSTSFSYRVVSNSDTSTTGTFATAPNGIEPFRFGAYGDTRSNTTPHTAVVNRMDTLAPDFVINAGDLVNFSTYTEFFSIEAPLLRDTPIFPSPGNHDVLAFYDFGFDRPNWYSFRWSNAFFVALCTDCDYSVGSDQYDWLQGELAAASADESVDWIFAFHHHPVYSSANHGSTANMQTTLNPLYLQYGVDAVFNSHDHVYERVVKDGIAYFVTGGGGADLYDFDTPVAGSESRVKANHVIVVDIDGGKFTLQAIGSDGTSLDTYEIEKSIGTDPTPTPTSTAEPTPTPGDPGEPADPSGGTGASCAVASTGSSTNVLALAPMLGLAALLLVRRRYR